MAEASSDPTNLLDDIYTSMIIPLISDLQQIRTSTREPMPAQPASSQPHPPPPLARSRAGAGAPSLMPSLLGHHISHQV
ncbi:hypothetical protein E2C01_067326 [Portunus trituberculatus]|uniref:Uncharacterized protein n=1 Tax=Portunus trituberculatus TaxID=210409 RepID=A0A5B7HKP4_PORTR|nr:hypothetical protein [Portunus trituberculatus]